MLFFIALFFFFFFFLLKKNGVPIIIHPFTCCSFKILGAARGWANVSFQRGLPACLLSGLADVLCILFYFFPFPFFPLFSPLRSHAMSALVLTASAACCVLTRFAPHMEDKVCHGSGWQLVTGDADGRSSGVVSRRVKARPLSLRLPGGGGGPGRPAQCLVGWLVGWFSRDGTTSSKAAASHDVSISIVFWGWLVSACLLACLLAPVVDM